MQRCCFAYQGPLHMSPAGRAGPVTAGRIFAHGSYEKFQLGFRDEIRPNILATSSGAKCEKASKHGETQKSNNFRAYHSFGNSYGCITAVKQDACDVENTAGNAGRCNPGIPETGQNCTKLFSQLTEIPVGKTEISGTEPARPVI